MCCGSAYYRDELISPSRLDLSTQQRCTDLLAALIAIKQHLVWSSFRLPLECALDLRQVRDLAWLVLLAFTMGKSTDGVFSVVAGCGFD